jgi:predicted Zn-ribbon and HTH transcriptional regulator
LTNNITIGTVPSVKHRYGFLTILEALDMEESQKKSVIIAGGVVCLVAAAAITYKNMHRSTVASRIPANATTWLKCINPSCNAAYEMSEQEYFKRVQESDSTSMGPTPIHCEKCGKNTAYRAEKCEKCGLVFIRARVSPALGDKCPGCGYSKSEATKKK